MINASSARVFQWFWECLCLMGKADESMYTVNQTTTPDSSLILPSAGAQGDSPLLESSLNTTVKRKRRHKHAYVNDHTDNAPNSKRFNSNDNEHGIDESVKKKNKHLIGLELRETERNYVTMLSNIIRVQPELNGIEPRSFFSI